MKRLKYYCTKCLHNHYFFNSDIGYRHRQYGRFLGWAYSTPRTPVSPRPRHGPARPSALPVSGHSSAGAPRQTPGAARFGGHAPMASSEHRKRKRRRNRPPAENTMTVVRNRASDAATDLVAAVIFDPGTGFREMADQILDIAPWYRRVTSSHWLCVAFDEAAGALSLDTYISLAGDAVECACVRAGAPSFAAKVIGKSASKLLSKSVSGGTDQLPTILRGLVLLVCPRFERCPAQGSVCSHFASPVVEQALRTHFA